MTSRDDPGCLRLSGLALRGTLGSVPSIPLLLAGREKPHFPSCRLDGRVFSGAGRPSVPWCRSAAGEWHCQPRLSPGPAGPARLRGDAPGRCSGSARPGGRLPSPLPAASSPPDTGCVLGMLIAASSISSLSSAPPSPFPRKHPKAALAAVMQRVIAFAGREKAPVLQPTAKNQCRERWVYLGRGSAAPAAEGGDRDAPSLSQTWSMFPEPGSALHLHSDSKRRRKLS